MRTDLPLWPLPLACALLPVVATWTAFALSLHEGHIDACNPFWDGCTSISRAARHGLGNHVFRAVLLPCAMLQILFWWLCRHWLTRTGRPVGPGLAALGATAGLFLILYATFLGTEGDIYRVLRRYGVTVYFAATYLALLLVLRGLARAPQDRLHRPLLIVALGMLALGVGSTAVTALVADPGLKDTWENALEWQLGLWLTALFALFAWRWRQLRIGITESLPANERGNGAAHD